MSKRGSSGTAKSGIWPVLREYDQDHLRRIALPLGGIGTGTISLGGRGDLRDWEIVNRPAKGFTPSPAPFFALWTRDAAGQVAARVLEGRIDPADYEGASGCTVPNHGLPHFLNTRFATAYPFGQVFLSDPAVPLEVRLEAFNPLVPADADASGIPVVVLRFVLVNRTSRPVQASVCGTVPNFIGCDGTATVIQRNRNRWRREGGLQGVVMSTEGLDASAAQWGTMALTTLTRGNVTGRTDWATLSWGDSLLDFWDDFIEDGQLEERVSSGNPAQAPRASLAVRLTVPPRAEKPVTFLITWHFPNRLTWVPQAPATTSGVRRAVTRYVNVARVSAFHPLKGAIESLRLPTAQGTLAWVDRSFLGEFLDLHLDIGRRGRQDEVVYLASEFRCPKAMSLDALLGYDGPVKLWLDGRPIFHDAAGTNPASQDEVRVGLGECGAGAHSLVVALGTRQGKAWGVFLRYERTDVPKSELASGTCVLPELAGQDAGCECGGTCSKADWVGNYYATRYRDAWDVARRTARDLRDLERRTVEFVRAFCSSDLPDEVKEAALFNVSTLRSQTTFRIASGQLLGWEGCGDKVGCCYGSCTHVWNYEQATAFLFGALSCTMRDVEFRYATDENGLMSFRVGLPLARAGEWRTAAADGQLGCIMKLYRDWQLSGDAALLRRLWPKARKALEFCWIPGGWDADRDGVMEGCQHNTMDVEYYGPNPQMGSWYLGALRAAEAMAHYLGEDKFAATCRSLFDRGSRWMDERLFNGQYYEHQVRPVRRESDIAPGLRVGMGAAHLSEPELQLGAGCLVDQLVGQFMAHVCGLGYLLDREHVRTTLASILKYNFRAGFHGHFNHMRSYVMNDESALLMASYPLGRRPKRPFPYYNEVMTGFEYTAAVGMLYEGMIAEGLRCVRAVRDRYDGQRRSPFNEAECGHHYARAMASWAAIPALTGFQYSGPTRTLTFAAIRREKQARWFWSTGYAWGTCHQLKMARGIRVTLEVLQGELAVERLELPGLGAIRWPRVMRIPAGRRLTAHVIPAKA